MNKVHWSDCWLATCIIYLSNSVLLGNWLFSQMYIVLLLLSLHYTNRLSKNTFFPNMSLSTEYLSDLIGWTTLKLKENVISVCELWSSIKSFARLCWMTWVDLLLYNNKSKKLVRSSLVYSLFPIPMCRKTEAGDRWFYIISLYHEIVFKCILLSLWPLKQTL